MLHLVCCPYPVARQVPWCWGQKSLWVTVAPGTISQLLHELLPLFSLVHNWLSTLLPKLSSGKKKSIWSCQFALKPLLTSFCLQNKFRSPWYAIQGPWQLAQPVLLSAIFRTYIRYRCLEIQEIQTFQSLTEFILNFYHIFCQSMDTKKNTAIIMWGCNFMFGRKGILM